MVQWYVYRPIEFVIRTEMETTIAAHHTSAKKIKKYWWYYILHFVVVVVCLSVWCNQRDRRKVDVSHQLENTRSILQLMAFSLSCFFLISLLQQFAAWSSAVHFVLSFIYLQYLLYMLVGKVFTPTCRVFLHQFTYFAMYRQFLVTHSCRVA